MRHLVLLGIMVVVAVGPGLASSRLSAKVAFGTPVNVGFCEFPAGENKVTGVGSEVYVGSGRGEKVSAASPARLTEADNEAIPSHTPNGVTAVSTQDGSTTVSEEIRSSYLSLSLGARAKVGR